MRTLLRLTPLFASLAILTVGTAEAATSSSAAASSTHSAAQERRATRAAKRKTKKALETRPSTGEAKAAIGIIVTRAAEHFLIKKVTILSPADMAGVHAGDSLLAIDGKELTSKVDVAEVGRMLETAPGESVLLKVGRLNAGEFDIVVRYDVSAVEDFRVERVQDVSVLRINRFGPQLKEEIRTACSQISDQRPLGVVIDLRSEPYGTLSAMGKLLSCFLPRETTFVRVYPHREMVYDTKYMTYDAPIFGEWVPVVVIANEQPAAAARIVAESLREQNRATLMVQPTYGERVSFKNLYAEPGESDVGALPFTVLSTAKGAGLNGSTGITEAIRVIPLSGIDQPLNRAIERIRGQ